MQPVSHEPETWKEHVFGSWGHWFILGFHYPGFFINTCLVVQMEVAWFWICGLGYSSQPRSLFYCPGLPIFFFVAIYLFALLEKTTLILFWNNLQILAHEKTGQECKENDRMLRPCISTLISDFIFKRQWNYFCPPYFYSLYGMDWIEVRWNTKEPAREKILIFNVVRRYCW